MAELKSGKTKEIVDKNIKMLLDEGFTLEEAKKIAASKAKTGNIKN